MARLIILTLTLVSVINRGFSINDPLFPLKTGGSILLPSYPTRPPSPEKAPPISYLKTSKGFAPKPEPGSSLSRQSAQNSQTKDGLLTFDIGIITETSDNPIIEEEWLEKCLYKSPFKILLSKGIPRKDSVLSLIGKQPITFENILEVLNTLLGQCLAAYKNNKERTDEFKDELKKSKQKGIMPTFEWCAEQLKNLHQSGKLSEEFIAFQVEIMVHNMRSLYAAGFDLEGLNNVNDVPNFLVPDEIPTTEPEEITPQELKATHKGAASDGQGQIVNSSPVPAPKPTFPRRMTADTETPVQAPAPAQAPKPTFPRRMTADTGTPFQIPTPAPSPPPRPIPTRTYTGETDRESRLGSKQSRYAVYLPDVPSGMLAKYANGSQASKDDEQK